jgi:hypothetical protein
MTTFDGAIVREQGVTFGVAVVRRGTLGTSQREAAIQHFSVAFGGIPTVLMEQDITGQPTFYGRSDIAKFLSGIDPRRLPWKRFSASL